MLTLLKSSIAPTAGVYVLGDTPRAKSRSVVYAACLGKHKPSEYT